MVNDLISREAAIDACHNLDDGKDAYAYGFVIEERLQKLPSAQPEIIRCKDCKWYEIYQLKKDGTDDRRYKYSYCVNLAFHARPDWFCADGERREE